MKKITTLGPLALAAIMCCATVNAQPPTRENAGPGARPARGARMGMDAGTTGPRAMRMRDANTSGGMMRRGDGMTSGMMRRGADLGTSASADMEKMREQMTKAREAIAKLSAEDQAKVRELRGEERVKFLKDKGIEMPTMMGRRGPAGMPGRPNAGTPPPPPPPAEPKAK